MILEQSSFYTLLEGFRNKKLLTSLFSQVDIVLQTLKTIDVNNLTTGNECLLPPKWFLSPNKKCTPA